MFIHSDHWPLCLEGHRSNNQNQSYNKVESNSSIFQKKLCQKYYLALFWPFVLSPNSKPSFSKKFDLPPLLPKSKGPWRWSESWKSGTGMIRQFPKNIFGGFFSAEYIPMKAPGAFAKSLNVFWYIAMYGRVLVGRFYGQFNGFDLASTKVLSSSLSKASKTTSEMRRLL